MDANRRLSAIEKGEVKHVFWSIICSPSARGTSCVSFWWVVDAIRHWHGEAWGAHGHPSCVSTG
jgi:hypothetical protein